MIHVIDRIAERTRKSGTQEDFETFALPHVDKVRLDEIHEKVAETLQEAQFQPVNAATVSFPSRLNRETLAGTQLSPGKLAGVLRSLHSTLESMMNLHCKTPGGREQELKRNKEDVKFLWIIGRHGKLLTEQGQL